MLRYILLTCLFAVPTVLASVQSDAQAPNYVITNLGVLPRGMESAAYGINSAGQVVGAADTLDNLQSYSHAFLWDQKNKMQDLGVLPYGVYSFATAINDVGQVVGTADVIGPPEFTEVQHCFMWDAVNGMVDIPGKVRNDDYYNANAYAINNSGEFVGGTDAYENSFGSRVWMAFVASGSGFSGIISSNNGISTAYGINSNGTFVGTNSAWNGAGGFYPNEAFLYDSSGVQYLGYLSGGSYSIAYAINDAGQIVGRGDTDGGLQTHAFLWQNGIMTDLDTLAGDVYSTAVAINATGQIVGGGSSTPILWFNGQGPYDLNTLIPANSGWTLQYANSINNSNQIVGTGTYKGSSLAFLLTPITLKSLKVNPQSVLGGSNVVVTVSLNFPAPASGAVVALTTTNTAINLPASLTIAAGKTSASASVSTSYVTAITKGTVTASYGAVSESLVVTVNPIGVHSLSLAPNPVTGGSTVVGTVTLVAPAAPGNITVTLQSNDTSLANPTAPSLTILAGQSSGTFNITTGTPLRNSTATITATANSIAKSVKLTVTP